MLYDKDIREPLFDFLDDIYLTNRIIEEKQMGRSRADVVMVTPLAIYGIEIKSDADTYARLKRQVRDYDNFYDYNYVVVGTSHAYHIQEHVPDYWGIITVEQSEGVCDFYVKRKPAKQNFAGLVRLPKTHNKPKHRFKAVLSSIMCCVYLLNRAIQIVFQFFVVFFTFQNDEYAGNCCGNGRNDSDSNQNIA